MLAVIVKMERDLRGEIFFGIFIPPSQSVLFWRLINSKLSTDGALCKRGVNFSSVCSLCYMTEKNLSHLFFRLDAGILKRFGLGLAAC